MLQCLDVFECVVQYVKFLKRYSLWCIKYTKNPCLFKATMAETNVEETMSHVDSAQHDGVAAGVEDTVRNDEVVESVNKNDVSNTEKDPGDCVKLEERTKTVLQEMANVVWPMKFDSRAVCKATGVMNCVKFNPLQKR